MVKYGDNMKEYAEKICLFCLDEEAELRTFPVFKESVEGELIEMGSKTEYVCKNCYTDDLKIIL